MKERLRIGTRGSQLALWQANWVKGCLEKRYPLLEVELVKVKTTGDKLLDVALAKVGGKGLFVKEIEEALLDCKIDLAVHSMKDVPTEIPPGLHISAITEREDPRDAFITGVRGQGVKGTGVPFTVRGFKDLPQGANIGTSSLRRTSQILNIRPDLKISQLRGNLNTRLKKLDEGQFDAIILAAAGIKRLGLESRITEYLEPDISLPAIGQGAIGIETRIDDKETNEMVAFLNHKETSACVRAERAFLKRLEGGCQVPIASYGQVGDGGLRLTGLVGEVDGGRIIKDSIAGPVDRGVDLGIGLAERLLEKGAWEILKKVYTDNSKVKSQNSK
ncbi:MAG: hydroxymethylbilane synthase [Deltaproteobacteria bacterium]|nr:hydroxymethylbilane synthase [Deltaproteobacteria bacterium]